MTIYHYVSSKDDILDGIVDLVLAEIELPDAALDWEAADAGTVRVSSPGARAPSVGGSAD